jgi:hypothetical protein
MPPREAITLRHDQRRFVDRHRNALPAARRAYFDRADSLRGEPAPEALAAAVATAFAEALAHPRDGFEELVF